MYETMKDKLGNGKPMEGVYFWHIENTSLLLLFVWIRENCKGKWHHWWSRYKSVCSNATFVEIQKATLEPIEKDGAKNLWRVMSWWWGVQDSPIFVASLDLKGEQSLQRVHRLGLSMKSNYFPRKVQNTQYNREGAVHGMSCTLVSHNFLSCIL